MHRHSRFHPLHSVNELANAAGRLLCRIKLGCPLPPFSFSSLSSFLTCAKATKQLYKGSSIFQYCFMQKINETVSFFHSHFSFSILVSFMQLFYFSLHFWDAINMDVYMVSEQRYGLPLMSSPSKVPGTLTLCNSISLILFTWTLQWLFKGTDPCS